MTQMAPDIETIDLTETKAPARPGFKEPGDDDKFAHYVDKNKQMESAITGEPIMALCGKMWVPTRDASKFPVCPECKEVWESLEDDLGGSDE